ncbi:peptidase E [Microbacterium sp. USHLN186]|uniref:Type 1 glutamine amidotransferase-like domain-containing protein n=1 Tax=Microbacterium sp. USHLN186 TaxID=3081286 RepID=UPI00301768B5
MTVAGTIVTLGGGGFSMSDDGRSSIDDLLLDLSGRETPKLCFIPTASGDSVDYCRRFEAAFEGRAETSVLSLFGNSVYDYSDPRTLLEHDVIYVGGGSTANLLAIWRLHGVPEMLQRAAAAGAILAGISAGMNCWFEASSTDSFGSLAPLDDGLAFLPGSACPHHHDEPGRQALYRDWVASGALPAGHGADDYTAIVWRDGEIVEAVGERSGRRVVRVERDAEHEIPVRRLPAVRGT